MQPTPEMMSPAQALARFMAGGDDGALAGLFAPDGATIVENFAPFLFEGPDAVARWREGFRAHAARNGLVGLSWRFGEPQDFSQDADRAFFVLPTRWTGSAQGRDFSEDGGWAFVLVRRGGAWVVRSYAWAVTSKA